MTEPAASAPKREPLPKGHVRCRVLKKGHDQIFTGEYEDNEHKKYAHNDEIVVPKATGQSLEDRGYAEIIS